jgi:TPR repeat protein
MPGPVTSPPSAPAEAPKAAPVPTPAEQLTAADHAIAQVKYADALAIITPLAEAGNAQAQSRLGNLYAEGQGVPRDIGAARTWYEKAAGQGDIAAELKLGAMYETGGAAGVPSSYFMAYIWYGLAARQGSGPGKAQAARVASQMQPAERVQAEKVIENKFSLIGKKP